MPYDEALAAKVRDCLDGQPELVERRMFGGLCFTVRGNMCCGILGDDLMVRVGKESYVGALAQTGARPVEVSGRPMTGMVLVGPPGQAALMGVEGWVQQGLDYALSLPPKAK